MDHKELCKKAFSAVNETYPCSDHDTAFKNVIERAKTMKKDVNMRQGNIREITVEHYEPKKSTKVLRAVAGVAATAAVLTGAVFGLRFLAENGGLKEGSSDELRAGYSQNASVTTADTEQPEFTAIFQAYSSDGHDLASVKAELQKKYDETMEKKNALLEELTRLRTLPDEPETEKSIGELEKQIKYYEDLLKEYGREIAELDDNAEYTTATVITTAETSETTVTTEVSDAVTTATAEWSDETTHLVGELQVTDGMPDHTDVTLALGEGNVKILSGKIYDGRILKLRLAGDIDDETRIGIRSVKNPRNIIQGGSKNDDGTFTFSALIPVPEGETDTLELLDLGTLKTEGKPKVTEVINISGNTDYEPLTERVGVDMTGYGIPDEALEWMWLSPFGLEMYFTSDKLWKSPNITVEWTSPDGTVYKSKGHSGTGNYDESTGKYHTTLLIVPNEDTDLTQMKEFSINGLKTKRAEFMPRSFWDDPEDYSETMTPVETFVQIAAPEE